MKTKVKIIRILSLLLITLAVGAVGIAAAEDDESYHNLDMVFCDISWYHDPSLCIRYDNGSQTSVEYEGMHVMFKDGNNWNNLSVEQQGELLNNLYMIAEIEGYEGILRSASCKNLTEKFKAGDGDVYINSQEFLPDSEAKADSFTPLKFGTGGRIWSSGYDKIGKQNIVILTVGNPRDLEDDNDLQGAYIEASDYARENGLSSFDNYLMSEVGFDSFKSVISTMKAATYPFVAAGQGTELSGHRMRFA